VSAEPVVLVTGGSNGIGRATVERFVTGGWRAIVIDRAPYADTASSGVVRSVLTDVTDVAALDAAVSEAIAAAGRLDAAVVAAGVWSEGPIETVTEDEFDRVFDVNVRGVVFTARAVVPALRETRGSLTLLASDAGIQGNRGAALYCASKGAVVLFAKTLALDLAPDGVRVNAVCPGDVDTPMLQGQADAMGDGRDDYLRRLLAGYPQGEHARFIDPTEVAELIWFLAQPAARAITGAAISIDQGLSAGIT
jgi:NAD(P)-dependent dehydrogenase (short-subunit alcohol dehydrogenase family)